MTRPEKQGPVVTRDNPKCCCQPTVRHKQRSATKIKSTDSGIHDMLRLITASCLCACVYTEIGLAQSCIQATIKDEGVLFTQAGKPLLFYQRQTKSQAGKHPRANYIHPLYDLDGNVLTEDFPADHPHHRGIFWAWHQLWVGDQKMGDGWACQGFAWDVTQLNVEPQTDGSMLLKACVHWKSSPAAKPDETSSALVEERTTIRITAAPHQPRTLDFTIRLRALQENTRIGGSENDKGYGGFSTRIRLPDGVRFVSPTSDVTPQRTAVEAGPALDILGRFGAQDKSSGLAILCHPSNPGFPQPWLLRSKRSMQNVAYPGRHAVVLPTDGDLTLRYRLVIHRGSAASADLQRWQQDYAGCN